MSRKHNTKHRRSLSNYPARLADRGLKKTPMMKWTGLTFTQIQNEFGKLPSYRWKERVEIDEITGKRTVRQIRELVGGKNG